ncbi:hypothetical protein FRC11_004664 [Ceratobasidium sp. 423]|nr:hypothetical protein FRC11_004664 [Ceratobasidium sp. 423]
MIFTSKGKKQLTRSRDYEEIWSLSDIQGPQVTCIETLSGGTIFASASSDGTLLFGDIESGTEIGRIDFRGHMYILCMIWRSSTTLLVGCSNGVLYELLINPTNMLRPASMYPIIGSLPNQIRTIAFDNSGLHSLLAVGHSTRVTVYSQTIPGHEWKKIDEIQEPSNDASGLVNGLFFFGNKERKSHKERKLFVGYAAEGWSIWQYKSGGGTGDLRRISPAHFSNVCHVGQVRLAPNQERVSIATLDQSAVIYQMSDNGPILESAEPYPLQVPLPENPVLPIAYTSTDLVLGGTSSGDIPVIKSDGAVTPRLRHADGHLLRAVTPHTDLIGEYEYVIAGSTGRDGKTTLKGYVRYIGTHRWFSFPKRAKTSMPSEPFQVALSDVLVMGSDEAYKRTFPNHDLEKVTCLGRFFKSTKVKFLLADEE